ncbi:MAG: hypothetical protein IT322_21255 [Anaerolineae bacterium]|nr:hypothetical protein [Anaerolineae bacterium]
MSDRPLPIVGIAAYYFIFGFLALFGGLFNSVVGTLAFCFAPALVPQGIIGVITGVLNLLLAGAVWSGKSWGQLVVSVLAVIGIVIAVLHGVWLSLIVNALVLLYMQGAEAKRFFGSN